MRNREKLKEVLGIDDKFIGNAKFHFAVRAEK